MRMHANLNAKDGLEAQGVFQLLGAHNLICIFLKTDALSVRIKKGSVVNLVGTLCNPGLRPGLLKVYK